MFLHLVKRWLNASIRNGNYLGKTIITSINAYVPTDVIVSTFTGISDWSNLKGRCTESGIADFHEIWHECSFRKNTRSVFFLIDNGWLEEGENYFQKVGMQNIFLLNISEIVEDTVFVYIDEISVFLMTNLTYGFVNKILFKQYIKETVFLISFFK